MTLGLILVSFAPLAIKEFPALNTWLQGWTAPPPR